MILIGEAANIADLNSKILEKVVSVVFKFQLFDLLSLG